MFEALICDKEKLKLATKENPVHGALQQVCAISVAEAVLMIDKIIETEETKKQLKSVGILDPVILDIVDSSKKMVYSYEEGFIGLDKC